MEARQGLQRSGREDKFVRSCSGAASLIINRLAENQLYRDERDPLRVLVLMSRMWENNAAEHPLGQRELAVGLLAGVREHHPGRADAQGLGEPAGGLRAPV